MGAACGMLLYSALWLGGTTTPIATDIMIEVDPNARITVFDYVDIKEYIAKLFDERVDVVNREGLKSHVRPAVTADVIYAF